MSKAKTNFIESVLLTLAVMVVNLIVFAGFWVLQLLFPERIGIIALYGLFSLWFFGFLLNRILGLKLKV